MEKKLEVHWEVEDKGKALRDFILNSCKCKQDVKVRDIYAELRENVTQATLVSFEVTHLHGKLTLLYRRCKKRTRPAIMSMSLRVKTTLTIGWSSEEIDADEELHRLMVDTRLTDARRRAHTRTPPPPQDCRYIRQRISHPSNSQNCIAMAQKFETSWESIQETRTRYRLDDILLKYKGVIGVDISYKEVQGKITDTLGITVYVKRKLQNVSADVALPKTIRDIPTDVVECPNVWPQEKGEPSTTESDYTNTWPYEQKMLPMETDGAQHLTTSFTSKSLAGGSRIRNGQYLQYYGTLGIILYDNVKNISTGLSCAHVMQADQNVYFEESFHNPIGTVSKHYYGVHGVDAAVLSIHWQPKDHLVGLVRNIGIIEQYGTPTLKQEVKKMGATTSVTQGRVRSTTLTWKYTDHNLGEIPPLYNQIMVENWPYDFAMEGDSGSAVIAECDGKLSMVGMVVSGDPDRKFAVCNNAYDLQECFPQLQFTR